MKSTFALLFITILLALTLHGLPGNLHPNGKGANTAEMNVTPFESSLERGRYAQTISLAESKDFNVDEFTFFVKPDLAWYNGHYFPAFPVGISVLAVPFYMFGKLLGFSQVFTYMISGLFTLLTAVTIVNICKKLGFADNVGALSAILFACASVALPYSATLSAHSLSAFIIAYGFWCYLNIDPLKNNSRNLMTLWLLFGLNLFVDYPNLVIFLPLLIGAFFKTVSFKLASDTFKFSIWFEFISSAFILILPLSIFVYYNQLHYNRPIALTNTFNVKFLEGQGVDIEKDKLTNEMVDSREYSSKFKLDQTLSGMKTLLLSHDRGLFYYSPIFLFALIGAYIFGIHKAYNWVIMSMFLFNVLIYASYDDPWGGWSFGPRYLIVTFPLLCVLCGAAFDTLLYRNKRYAFLFAILIFGLFVFSTGVAIVGALTTNTVPSSIEAIGTNMKDNFLLNWDLLNEGKVSSFVYTTYLKDSISPLNYFYALLILVSAVFLVLLV